MSHRPHVSRLKPSRTAACRARLSPAERASLAEYERRYAALMAEVDAVRAVIQGYIGLGRNRLNHSRRMDARRAAGEKVRRSPRSLV